MPHGEKQLILPVEIIEDLQKIGTQQGVPFPKAP